jgi:hypothetical protein
MPPFVVLGTQVRTAVLVHPGRPPGLYLSSIGCLNPAKPLRADQEFSGLSLFTILRLPNRLEELHALVTPIPSTPKLRLGGVSGLQSRSCYGHAGGSRGSELHSQREVFGPCPSLPSIIGTPRLAVTSTRHHKITWVRDYWYPNRRAVVVQPLHISVAFRVGIGL